METPSIEEKLKGLGDIEKLATAHWGYIEQVIRNEYEIEQFDEEYCRAVKFHYITAFIHGYKHGEEA